MEADVENCQLKCDQKKIILWNPYTIFGKKLKKKIILNSCRSARKNFSLEKSKNHLKSFEISKRMLCYPSFVIMTNRKNSITLNGRFVPQHLPAFANLYDQTLNYA